MTDPMFSAGFLVSEDVGAGSLVKLACHFYPFDFSALFLIGSLKALICEDLVGKI